MFDNNQYESLSIVDKVRVNAVIIDTLTSGDVGGLDAFRRLAYKRDPYNLEASLQSVLDDIRDTLAEQLDRVPDTKLNDVDDTDDLGEQSEFLRTTLGVMHSELSYITGGDTTTGRYYSPEYYQRLSQEERFQLPELKDVSGYTLTGLVTEVQMREIINSGSLSSVSGASVGTLPEGITIASLSTRDPNLTQI